jgi:hypothetical protein
MSNYQQFMGPTYQLEARYKCVLYPSIYIPLAFSITFLRNKVTLGDVINFANLKVLYQLN